jgi:Flp pilus assembly pilin Flp
MSRLLLKGSHAIRERLTGRHSDRGAGFVEYAGLLLLIAGIVILVNALGLDNQVANAVQNAVNSILG